MTRTPGHDMVFLQPRPGIPTFAVGASMIIDVVWSQNGIIYLNLYQNHIGHYLCLSTITLQP